MAVWNVLLLFVLLRFFGRSMQAEVIVETNIDLVRQITGRARDSSRKFISERGGMMLRMSSRETSLSTDVVLYPGTRYPGSCNIK